MKNKMQNRRFTRFSDVNNTNTYASRFKVVKEAKNKLAVSGSENGFSYTIKIK